MAKLKGPLFSLGAQGAIGKSLVYFGWKGIDCVREYVIPSNPKTALQNTQRGYLSAAVTAVHVAQAEATGGLDAEDVTAYALWASAVKAATTWFNQAVKQWIDRYVLAKKALICRGGAFSAVGAAGFRFDVYANQIAASPGCATGNFKYGTSKTALINTQAATPNLAGRAMWATFAGLAAKTKYYVQFKGLTGPLFLDAKSGIYHVTTT